jgi:hypothetical protein
MTAFGSQWTYDGKNSLEFKHAAAVMHESMLWILGEEEGLSRTSPTIARGDGAERIWFNVVLWLAHGYVLNRRETPPTWLVHQVTYLYNILEA